MKKFVFISSLLVAIMFVVVSCSKDDPRPASGSQLTDDKVFNWTFDVSTLSKPNDQNVVLDGNTIQLTSLLSTTNQDKAKYLSALNLNYNSANIVINNLSAGIVLNNVTIQTSDNTIKSLVLGKVTGTGSQIKFNDNSTITFLNSVCTSLFKNKSIKLNLSFTNPANQNISSGTVVITPNATLNW